jgi:cell division protein DivIC
VEANVWPQTLKKGGAVFLANQRQRGSEAASAGTKRRMRFYWAGVVIFACWALYTLINQEFSLTSESQRLSDAKAQKVASESQMADLKQEIERLSDPEYIGQLANQQGMTRGGEKIIQSAE